MRAIGLSSPELSRRREPFQVLGREFLGVVVGTDDAKAGHPRGMVTQTLVPYKMAILRSSTLRCGTRASSEFQPAPRTQL